MTGGQVARPSKRPSKRIRVKEEQAGIRVKEEQAGIRVKEEQAEDDDVEREDVISPMLIASLRQSG